MNSELAQRKLDAFLKARKIEKTDKTTPYTHTRIGDKSLGIFGGTFNIPPADMPTFSKLYSDLISCGGHEYLTEKQIKADGCIAIDLDFRYPFEVDTRKHTSDHYLDFINFYLEEAKKVFQFCDGSAFDVFVFEKPHVNRVENKQLTKDGIHIIFGLHTPRELQKYLRSKVVARMGEIFGELGLTNPYDEVFDDNVSSAGCNWMLCGSQKPNNEAYELKFARIYKFEDGDFCTERLDFADFQTQFDRVSVQRTDFARIPLTSIGRTHAAPATAAPAAANDMIIVRRPPAGKADTDYKKVEEFIAEGIFDARAKDYSQWVNMAFALFNAFGADEGLVLFDEFSKRCTAKYDAYQNRDFWDKLTISVQPENKLTIKSIMKWARDDDAEIYTRITAKYRHYKAKAADNNEYRFVADDNAAANLVVNDVKDILIPSHKDGRLFMKVKNVWICDDDAVNNYLLNFILKSNICKANDDNKYLPYAQNVKSAKNVREAVIVKIRAPTQDDAVVEDIYSKFHTTTKGRLCFRDGVLDFKAKKFYKWEEVDFEYYTTVAINYDFADYFAAPDLAVVNEIKTNIYETLYGNKITKALNFLSRGIAGHYEDKNWATYLGNRNCGKGVQFDNLANAFEKYISSFELGNLLYERATNTEEVSRKLYWLLDLEFVRLGVSQETPPPEDKLKLNGKMMKKLAGGGDEHKARRNFDRRDTTFKIDTTFMIMGNNELKVDVKDALEHCLEFSSVSQFKTKAEIDKMKADGEDELIWGSYKVKDAAIKDKCQTAEWKKATVYLLYQHYIDSAVAIERDTNDVEVDELSIRKRILLKYVVTHDENDYILCSDLIGDIKDCKKKIHNELASMGVIKKKSNRGDYTRDKQCYFGLKSVLVEENEVDCP